MRFLVAQVAPPQTRPLDEAVTYARHEAAHAVLTVVLGGLERDACPWRAEPSGDLATGACMQPRRMPTGATRL